MKTLKSHANTWISHYTSQIFFFFFLLYWLFCMLNDSHNAVEIKKNARTYWLHRPEQIGPHKPYKSSNNLLKVELVYWALDLTNWKCNKTSPQMMTGLTSIIILRHNPMRITRAGFNRRIQVPVATSFIQPKLIVCSPKIISYSSIC